MKGYGSWHSPFARKVRVVAIETGQEDAIEWTMIDMADRPSGLYEVNPLGQVPAVIDDEDGALYDSCVICEFLDSRHDGPKIFPAAGPARWKALRIQALGDGLGDAAIGVAAERRRPEEKRFEPAMASFAGKVEAGLEAAERALDTLSGAFTIGPLSVAAAIGYMEFRDCAPGWRDRRAALADWYDQFCDRPSMQRTAPPKS